MSLTNVQRQHVAIDPTFMNKPWGNAFAANTTPARNFSAKANAKPMAKSATRVNVRSTRSFRPRPGKVMRECTGSNTSHTFGNSGLPCKYVHKNDPEHVHLRPEQRLKGGSRRGGGIIKIVPSPAPLSKVNTYTSWPGGIDPTVPLYDQKTMLGGKRSGRSKSSRSRKLRNKRKSTRKAGRR